MRLRKVVRRVPAALAAALVLAIASCSQDSKPVAAVTCDEVSVPMVDIPTRTDQEPRLRIPQPQGWERTTKLDSETIRFALRNESLTDQGFTPNAVVTLQKVSTDVGKPQQILDAQDKQLVAKLKVKDLKSTPTQVCGSPAQSTSYTAPAMGKIPARNAASLAVVYQAGDVNYVTTVTVQTIKPDNPTYVTDSAAILKGFQILPPK